MTDNSNRWADLRARLVTSLALVVVGLSAVLAGGVWFQMLTLFATAVMVWELWMMIRPEWPELGMLMTALSASVMAGLMVEGQQFLVVFFLITPVVGAIAARVEKRAFFVFALLIQVAAWGLVLFRESHGAAGLVWLILVVVVTDVAGYFVGKTVGGPKFWPKVSPKKTWSGTAGGWIAAALVGVLGVVIAGLPWWIVPLSVALSMASQMGDIAESALKRRRRVKDSSDLLPGHGGLFDRFDGLLGASLFMLAVTWLAQGFA